ncbi:MAG: AMP-binding protein, partial [Polaromonas sp.]|nr:AMP-binding protein [Polaromonas sp.]
MDPHTDTTAGRPRRDWDRLTIGDAVRDSAIRYPEAVAIVDGDRRVTYAKLDLHADELAHGLRAQGIVRGDQVAMWLTNGLEWVSCWIACARLGAVVVPINTRYKVEEAQYIIRQSDAKALIMMDCYWDIDFLGMARSMVPELDTAISGDICSASLPQLRSVILWKSVSAPGTLNLDGIAAEGAARMHNAAELPEVQATDPVVIVFTSGTTGHPKGAMHNHKILRNSANVARFMHVGPEDVVLGHMPFYHVAGCIGTVGMCLLVGCTLVTLPQWIVDEALEVIERERVTIFGGIPTHFVDCLDSIRRTPRD